MTNDSANQETPLQQDKGKRGSQRLKALGRFIYKITKWIAGFFAFSFVALIFINLWSGEEPPILLPGTVLQWSGYLFIVVLVLGIAMIVLQFIYGIVGKMRPGNEEYSPNLNELLLLSHSFLAATWTGLTSAQGFKLITAPLSPWSSIEGVVAMLGGLMAAILVLSYWNGLFSLVDRDADASFPVTAEKKATNWNLEKENFQKTATPVEEISYWFGAAFIWLWNGVKGRGTDFGLFLAALFLFVIPVSTITTVVGVSGQDALFRHVVKQYDLLESSLEGVNDFRLEEDAVAQKLLQQSKDFEALSERALEGLFSGASGKGAIYNTFDESSDQYKRWAVGLQEAREDYTAKFLALTEEISSARTEFRSSYQIKPEDGSARKTVFELLDLQRTRLAALRSNVLRLRNESQLPAIHDSLKANIEIFSINPEFKESEIEGGTPKKVSPVDRLPKYMQQRLEVKEGAVRKRQIETLIERLPPLIEGPKQVVEDIGFLINSSVEATPTFEDISLLRAVITYWEEIAISWFIAIAIDFGLILWAFWILRNGKLRLLKQPKYKPQIQP